MKAQYKGVRDITRDYWASYGGWKALISSPYVHGALLMSVLAYGLSSGRRWSELAVGILPNVLGFSVGGYAILMSFGGEKFLAVLAKVEAEGVAALKGVSAAFVHFVLVQTATLGWALLSNGTGAGPLACLHTLIKRCPRCERFAASAFHWFGGFLLWYSLLCGVAATMGIFRLARMFVAFSSVESAQDAGSAPRPKPPERPS